jgi:hypothetical protein
MMRKFSSDSSLDEKKLFKGALVLWAIFATAWFAGIGTLLYFVVAALNKYING